MAKIISFINLKGGVGKTTTSVNIAATLAQEHHKRVLLIDLDPQTNATISVISQEEWKELQDSNQTLFNLFHDLLTGSQDFSIDEAIRQNVGGIKGLDLLPSSLLLVDVQDDIPSIDNKAYISHVDVLKNTIEKKISQYDCVIIDCPPNLGSITLNGINISHYYIIPTVPDILSRTGIALIKNRIENFKRKKSSCLVRFGGILFTKVDRRTILHRSIIEELRRGQFGECFEHEFPQRISIAEAVIDSRPFLTSTTAQSKTDWFALKKIILDITQELIERVGL